VTLLGTLLAACGGGGASGHMTTAISSSSSGANMIARDGNLYGVGQSGGTYDHGMVYTLTDITSGTSQAQILYSFGATGDDATKPTQAPAQGLDGNFYGVTATGGENNAGTVFKLVVPGSH
jgi:uncharacterized repeat protein (TIGR03803 family)